MRPAPILCSTIMMTLCVALLPARPASADVQTLRQSLDAVARELPAFADAADVAAARFVRNPRLAVRGAHPIAIDLATRPGGFANYHAAQTAPGGVVLYHFNYAPRSDSDEKQRLAQQLRDAIQLRATGHVVIGFVNQQAISAYGGSAALGQACDAVINVAGPGPDAFEHLVSAWTFQAELFAACTRLGKTPVLRLSPRLDRKRWHAQRYEGLDFHGLHTVKPIAPGVLGGRYLAQLGELIQGMAHVNDDALRKARQRIAAANAISKAASKATESTAWLAAAPSTLSAHAAGTGKADANALRWLSDPAAVKGQDVVIAFGTDHAPGEPWWPREQIAAMQRAASTVYVLDSCYLDPRRDVARGDLLIKTWQPWEDAVVKIDGHKPRLGATSGVLTEAIYYLLTAADQ